MIFVFSSKNRCGPLVFAVILTSVFLGALLMSPTKIPLMSAGSLIFIFNTAPLFGLMFASPALVLAYIFLSGRKNKPGFWSCILWATLLGALITLLWAPLWTELGKELAYSFAAGGPLTGLFYYLTLKPENGDEDKIILSHIPKSD